MSPSTPSMSTSVLVLLAEEKPRTRMPEVSDPGSPLLRRTCTPGMAPWMAERASGAGRDVICSPFTTETEPLRSTFFWMP